MYAIVRDGSTQLRVEHGATIRLAYRGDVEPGTTLQLDDVLLVASGDTVQVGRPKVEGASVAARVTRHAKDKKVLVYKYKRRKTHHVKQGHRQRFTEAVVEAIEAPGA